MSKNRVFRAAASGLAIGLVAVGCTPAGYRPTTLAAKAPKAEKDASKQYAHAWAALQAGKHAEALTFAEKAVELAPRDLGYRMVLGDLYLKNGRFVSAEQAFNDVLVLNPGNARASMSIALARIAQGNNASAIHMLDSLAGIATVTDLGLAYALAGQPQRAVAMLEPAAREPGADGRLRQNLALAYALSGDWPKARMVAAQDVSPAELNQRLQQWAALSQPQAAHSQVASLLGIENVVADGGQPSQLALAPEPAQPTAVAEATTPVAPQQVLAEAVTVQPAAPEKMAAAVESLVKQDPVVKKASLPASTTPLPAFKPAQERMTLERIAAKRSNGRFVVQLGAYRHAHQAEKAWASVQTRYSIGDREPLSTTVTLPGKGLFHRLSVAGFDTAADAQRLCRSIKSKGGACFVRSNAGDNTVQWASRAK
jgi:Flp pilus assembly protein TadD